MDVRLFVPDNHCDRLLLCGHREAECRLDVGCSTLTNVASATQFISSDWALIQTQKHRLLIQLDGRCF